MTNDSSTWAHQGVLSLIGARFVAARLDDAPETIASSIEELTGLVGADFMSVTRVDHRTLRPQREQAWARIPEYAVAGSRPFEVTADFGARFMSGSGTEVATLAEILGDELVEERGWDGGTAVVSLIDQTPDTTTVLVVAGVRSDWGDPEIDLMRGFATLLRQFNARIRLERELSYRLALEDLVSTSAARLASVVGEDCEPVVARILADVHTTLSLASVVLIDVLDEKTVQLNHFIAAQEVPDELRRLEVPNVSQLPGAIGPSLFDYLAGERVLDVAVLVGALAGPEAVAGLDLADAPRTIALIPAPVTTAGMAVIAIGRDGDESVWLAEEYEAIRTIASLIGQTRGRIAAERSSAFHLGVQQALAQSAAAFLAADASQVDAVVAEAMERVCLSLGADGASVSSMLTDPDRCVTDVAFMKAVGVLDAAELPAFDVAPSDLAALRSGHVVDGRIGDDGAGRGPESVWSHLTAPIRDEADELSTVGIGWNGELPDEHESLGDLVLALADLIGQLRIRLRAQGELEQRLELDLLLSSIADSFLGAAAADHDAVVQDALVRVGQYLDLAGATVRRIERDETIAEAVFTTTPDVRVGDRLPFGGSGRADRLLRGEWIHLHDPPAAWTESLRNRWGFTGTMVSGPVTVGSEVRACLNGLRSDHREWSPLELEAFRAFATMLGQLRARVEAERRDERQLAAQRVLSECAVELAEARADTIGSTIDAVVERVCTFLGLDALSTWAVDFGEERYTARAGWSQGGDAGERFASARDWGTASVMDETRRLGRRVVIEGDEDAAGDGGVVAVPRGERGRVDSILLAESGQSVPWRTDTVQMIEALSHMIHQVETRVGAERYADAAFDAAPIGILLRDRQLRLITCNQAFAEFIGAATTEELIGTMPDEIYDDGFEAVEWTDVGGQLVGEAAFRRRNGGRVWGQMRSSVIEGARDGEMLWLSHIEDVTDRRRAEQLLRFQASHDELTGLANRRELLDEVRRVAVGSGSVAILLLDLDRFKLINDSLGHDRGDELLVVIADRLRLAIRPGDLVARLGGDEFAVVLPGPVTVSEAEFVADRLLGLIGEPVTLGHQEIFPSASIGIAVADHGVGVSDLLRRADTAMYRAKSQGRARHEAFDEQLREEVMARMATEAGLRGALRNDELLVYYQPEVDLRTGEVLAVEALVRWQHPDKGLLAAGEFIETAEETGLVVDIGELVLGRACREAMTWPGGADAPLLRVNFAAAQIQRDDSIGIVRGALRDSGLPPERLCLEITESAVMNDLDRSGDTLDRLKEIGVTLAVDDFGTGFSSLAYLKMFPVDVLKIDRAFVSGLGGDPEDTAFVRSIVSLAEALGLHVVAEGVETEEQAEALVELGCTRAQGYLFARPGPPAELRAFLTRR